MATTLQTLRYYYSNVMRVDPAAQLPTADATLLTTLATQVDAGNTSLSAAQQTVAKLAINTTSVANLAYNFFTGLTPYSGGLDYLVSPTGGNATNLNASYYQSFNLENRYINFAVNLGKLGEGATKFAAEYGSLTLEQAVVKAYVEIFGVAKEGIEGILTADVGGQTRAQYFAYYGRDGLTGIGTKAAMVGWLLAEAAKADIGFYAKAESAFLADLGPDGIASFHTNIVSTYGPQPAGSAGAAITVTNNQSVSLTAADPALKSTSGNDTVSGANGLDTTQSIQTGDGNDAVTVTGAVGGLIDTGAGNDTVVVGTLNSPVVILGGGVNGAILTGSGNDIITITQDARAGSTIDAGAGDDTLIFTGNTGLSGQVKVSGVEHIAVTGIGVDLANVTGVNDVWINGNGAFSTVSNVQSGTIVGVRGRVAATVSYAAGSTSGLIHLDGVTTVGQTVQNPTNVIASNLKGTLYVNVDTDSSVGNLFNLDGDTVVIRGPGSFTGTVTTTGRDSPSKSVIDASAAASVNINYSTSGAVGAPEYTSQVTLSGGSDTVSVFLGAYRTFSTFTLGAGSDTFKVVASPVGGPISFTNLGILNNKVIGYATITDFQKGLDHIDMGVAFTSITSLTSSVGGATTLEQALINVSPNLAANSLGVFEYAGDSYIYRQDATVGANTADGLIKLVGVTGLTVGTGAANVDIHYG